MWCDMAETDWLQNAKLYRGNLHGHSTHSDGMATPEEVISAYYDLGYDFTCLSDHLWADSSFAATTICDGSPWHKDDFITIPSAEMHCYGKAYDNDGLWHIVANGLPLDFAPASDTETAPELIGRAQDAGAYVSLAHPEWYSMTTEEARSVAQADAVEVFNHACSLESGRPYGLGIADFLIQEGHRPHLTATDDSHFRLADAGGGWVMVGAAALTQEAILTALKAGHFYASTGPEFKAINFDGDKVTIRCSAARTLFIQGAGHRALNRNGTAITSATFDLSELKSPWCRITIIDAAGKQAWSNPFDLSS